MIEKLFKPSCPPSMGKSPPGQSIPLIVFGVKLAGVHEPTRKSNVSLWLGAPVQRMKMQYLAVFKIVVGPV